MLGIKFIKIDPSDFVLQYKKGKIIREGVGLSFFCFAPTTSLVLVPIGSVDVPFIFEEVTADFQQITVQGQLSYKVSDPKKLANMMNFTLAFDQQSYVSDDPLKLPKRLINQTQVLTRASLKSLSLKDALGQSDTLVTTLREVLQKQEMIKSLGVDILGISILAIKPTPEMSRALEAEAREKVLRESDEAVYARRNAAVQQERAIKENELNTEIAIENKKRQIRETQMEAEKSVQHKKYEIKEAEMNSKIEIEKRNKDLVALATINAKEESDAKAYSIAAVMKAVSQADPKTLQALVSVGMDPAHLLALAFKELAASSEKIGQLNISPDLMRELLDKQNPPVNVVSHATVNRK